MAHEDNQKMYRDIKYTAKETPELESYNPGLVSAAKSSGQGSRYYDSTQ